MWCCFFCFEGLKSCVVCGVLFRVVCELFCVFVFSSKWFTSCFVFFVSSGLRVVLCGGVLLRVVCELFCVFLFFEWFTCCFVCGVLCGVFASNGLRVVLCGVLLRVFTSCVVWFLLRVVAIEVIDCVCSVCV